MIALPWGKRQPISLSLRTPLPGVVPIVMADPCHPVGKALLVATLRHKVEEVVGADQDVEPARVGRVGVEDGAAAVPVQNAPAAPFIALHLGRPVILLHLLLPPLLPP